MKNAIILHGCPEKEDYYNPKLPSESNAHWLPWLQKELLIRDIPAVTPEIPHAYDPQWDAWVREVERFDIGPETILVGHSCGAGFWVKYLSINPQCKVGKVILVAPWLDPDHTIDEQFFAFTPDPGMAERTDGLVVFSSKDDSDSTQRSIEYLAAHVPSLDIRTFSHKGHFTYDNLNGPRFPELLQEITGGPCET